MKRLQPGDLVSGIYFKYLNEVTKFWTEREVNYSRSKAAGIEKSLDTNDVATVIFVDHANPGCDVLILSGSGIGWCFEDDLKLVQM